MRDVLIGKKLRQFLSLLIFSIISIPVSYADSNLSDDFRPAVGKGEPSPVGGYRLLTAESEDGLTWTKTNFVISDRASVADAVITESGRIIIYYVTVCKVINGSEVMSNDIVAAVSDDNGKSWVYKEITFSGEPAGGTKPVDPNAVLLPDGNINLFVTIDPDQNGTERPQTYSALSTDGGFNFAISGKVFSVTGGDVLDPENYRYSSTNWRIYSGGTPGTTRTALSTDNGSTFTDLGTFTTVTDDSGTNSFIVADITKFSDSLHRIYMFGKIGSADGIRSMYSSNSGVSWAVDTGNRLTVDTSSTVESSKVWAPTVLKKTDGKYLMIYETEIPSTVSSTIVYSEIISENTYIIESETESLSLRSVYADSARRDITKLATWSSSNQSVATVNSAGKVTAVSSGTALITATYSSYTDTMTVFVESNSTPPVITTSNISPATQGIAYSDTVTVTDSDSGDTVIFTKLTGPGWLSVNTNGILSGTPSNEDVGDDISVIIKATDSYNLADTLYTTIDVINVTDPPSNLVISDVPDDNGHQLQLNWTLSTDEQYGYIDKYLIYRSQNPVLTDPVPLSNFVNADTLVFYEKLYTILIDSVSVGVNEYIDTFVPLNSAQYYYWIQAEGASGPSQKITNGSAVSVENQSTPSEYELFYPFPNPFNMSSTISFRLPEDTKIRLCIYSSGGQLVDTLADGYFHAGKHSIVWNPDNNIASGVYFCKLETGLTAKSRKIMLLK